MSQDEIHVFSISTQFLIVLNQRNSELENPHQMYRETQENTKTETLLTTTTPILINVETVGNFLILIFL